MNEPELLRKTRLVRSAHVAVDHGGVNEAIAQADVLEAAGFVRGQHLGSTTLTPLETVEWYGGQFIDIVRTESWFAMNSWVNCIDKFAPLTPPPEESK